MLLPQALCLPKMIYSREFAFLFCPPEDPSRSGVKSKLGIEPEWDKEGFPTPAIPLSSFIVR